MPRVAPRLRGACYGPKNNAQSNPNRDVIERRPKCGSECDAETNEHGVLYLAADTSTGAVR